MLEESQEITILENNHDEVLDILPRGAERTDSREDLTKIIEEQD